MKCDYRHSILYRFVRFQFPKFMSYQVFFAHQTTALEYLQQMTASQPDVATYVRTCERLMTFQMMPLSSYFLKPVQRISKYKQLIEKVGSSIFRWISTLFILPTASFVGDLVK